MAFTLTAAPEADFLRLTLSGAGNDDEVSAIVRAVSDAVRSRGARKALIDVRGVQGRLGVADTFFLVRSYPPDLAEVATAVLESEKHRAIADFHELSAANVGRNLKFFFDEASARGWLAARP